MKVTSVVLVMCVLCRTGWSVIDDDVAILVTSLTTTRPTTNRPSPNRNTIPRHPFLYKKDYKDWLGLKTGTTLSSLYPSSNRWLIFKLLFFSFLSLFESIPSRVTNRISYRAIFIHQRFVGKKSRRHDDRSLDDTFV